MTGPNQAQIFHITHVRNLNKIINTGGLLSDVAMIERGGPDVCIGMARIKGRRLGMPIDGLPGVNVGACVPFNFCPRSVMLYLISRRSSPDLTYVEGQDPVVHLQFDFEEVVSWAEAHSLPWAISLINASATYAEFRTTRDGLNELYWEAINARQWSRGRYRECKQAECLVNQGVAWELVRRIGTKSQAVANQVSAAMISASHRPTIEIRPEWYY